MVSTPTDAVVTGDAVVLDVQIAQLPVRAVSALIDITVMLIGYIIGVLLWAFTLTRFDSALAAATLIIFTLLTLVGYPLIMEATTRGRTLGKMSMGLRVVSDDGGPERFRQALFRALSGFIEIWMFTGGPAVITSLLSSKGKRLGDIFAGTMVINERGPKLAPPPLMPPTLAWWASTLELSALQPAQAEVARQFLARARQLNPDMREQMVNRIAHEIVAQISPPPPPGTPASVMLAAVLAERHRRELARLASRVIPPAAQPAGSESGAVPLERGPAAFQPVSSITTVNWYPGGDQHGYRPPTYQFDQAVPPAPPAGATAGSGFATPD